MADSVLARAIRNYRAEILNTESKASLDTLKAYARVRADLIKKIDELAKAIAQQGDLNAGNIFQFDRAKALLDQVDAQMTTLSGKTLNIIDTGQSQAVILGQEHALGTALVSVIGDNALTAQVASQWNHLNTGAVESMVGRLSNGTPLNEWMVANIGDNTERVSQALAKGIALGENPRAITARLAKELDVTAASLQNTVRDSVMDSYRDASLSSFSENSDIGESWTWVASLDETTCGTCLSLHGETFPLSQEFFESHNNCRCVPIFNISGVESPVKPGSGEEFFSKLDPEKQDLTLGKAAGEAYRNGDVQLGDFVKLNKDDTWGNAYVQDSFKNAQENAAARAGSERTAA
jgi:SPP1 gp7 family putative phage head morphogenesis protein